MKEQGLLLSMIRSCCWALCGLAFMAQAGKMDSDMDILNMVHDSMEAGGHGVSIGRNVFQNKNVMGITKAISSIVLDGFSVEEAAKFIK